MPKTGLLEDWLGKIARLRAIFRRDNNEVNLLE
jgi:hypothetical protein